MSRIHVLNLSRFLIGNTDAVLTVLESLEITGLAVNLSKNEIRFSREPDSNPSSCKIDLDTLGYYCFSTNQRGDLYTLVMDRKGLRFPNALRYVASVLGLEEKELDRETSIPFGGFYKKLQPHSAADPPMITYHPSILEGFHDTSNLLFLRDGISPESQAFFQVGYDLESMRITIPIWTVQGELCGVMGRLNDPRCPTEDRWLPIIPCSRSKTVYGYHQNYSSIQQKGLAVIGESEKFVMQLHTMGSRIGLSTCGCQISPAQAKYIRALMVPRLILAYDEGLEEEYIREQAVKLKSNRSLYTNEVGYVFDKENEILPQGSKASPSDLGRQAFADLIQHHVRWLT